MLSICILDYPPHRPLLESLLERLAKWPDAEIIVEPSEDEFLAVPRLRAFSRASGPYVTVMDQDDIPHKPYYLTAIELLEDNTQLDFVTCYEEIVGEPTYDPNPDAALCVESQGTTKEVIGIHGGVVYRKDFLEALLPLLALEGNPLCCLRELSRLAVSLGKFTVVPMIGYSWNKSLFGHHTRWGSQPKTEELVESFRQVAKLNHIPYETLK